MVTSIFNKSQSQLGKSHSHMFLNINLAIFVFYVSFCKLWFFCWLKGGLRRDSWGKGWEVSGRSREGLFFFFFFFVYLLLFYVIFFIIFFICLFLCLFIYLWFFWAITAALNTSDLSPPEKMMWYVVWVFRRILSE